MITQKELKELLNYNPDTGIFTWRYSRRGAKKGSTAGSNDGYGYTSIRVNSKPYGSHRLAWLYMFGAWPKNQIDHINHDRVDNRIENLREVTRQENGRNLALNKKNTSGVTGVRRKGNQWYATIGVNGSKVRLGGFKDKFEAICARKSANNKYGFHKNHGS